MKVLKNNTKAYFIIFASIAIFGILIQFFSFFFIRTQILDYEETKYHEKDMIIANYLLEADKDNSSAEVFTENDDTALLYVDIDGSIISKTKSTNVSVPGDNIFTILGKSKIYDITLEEARKNLVSGNSGRFEIYYAKQSKVLIYTPAGDGQHFMIRVVPKKIFKESRGAFSIVNNHELLFGILVLVLLFLIMLKMYKHITSLELANARRDLIAADNDLVSFVYHASIASFELTGAVERVFGADIAKRGQIDWNTLSGRLHPDDQKLFRNISKAIRDGDKKYTTEFRMCLDIAKEDYHWYRMNGKTVIGNNGEVNKFVGTIQNSDDQILQENMLKNKAEHDLLTGLLNKITSEEKIDTVIQNTKHSVFAFYIIDLDNFKAVNDNLGHAVGDKVLEDVSSKLKLVFNEADVIGRLGGDEFAVLLVIPPLMVSQAEKLICEKAEHLNEILRAEYGNDSIRIAVSASIGIARCPEAGNDFQSLYKCADKALYYSKENGKNRYTLYKDA